MKRFGRIALTVVLTGLAPQALAEELPAEAKKIVDAFEKAAAGVRERAEAELVALRRTAVGQLQPLQDGYTRAAKLDEALAIREAIRAIRGVRPDPGSYAPTAEDVGKILYFEVVGTTAGAVWGSRVYCAGSALATAAVHAGALRAKEKGVVKVTVLPGADSYQGSTRHGVTSMDYGSFKPAFTVEGMTTAQTVR
jgi:hypothetical protein